MVGASRPTGLAEVTPSLYATLGPRRRRQVEKIYSRLLAVPGAGDAPALAKRAYTNAMLVHVFTGNLCAVPGAVLLFGYFNNVSPLASRPVLVLGLVLVVAWLVEEVVGVRQAVQVGRYFRAVHDRESPATLNPQPPA